jgi:hypothetical protein
MGADANDDEPFGSLNPRRIHLRIDKARTRIVSPRSGYFFTGAADDENRLSPPFSGYPLTSLDRSEIDLR